MSSKLCLAYDPRTNFRCMKHLHKTPDTYDDGEWRLPSCGNPICNDLIHKYMTEFDYLYVDALNNSEMKHKLVGIRRDCMQSAKEFYEMGKPFREAEKRWAHDYS